MPDCAEQKTKEKCPECKIGNIYARSCTGCQEKTTFIAGMRYCAEQYRKRSVDTSHLFLEQSSENQFLSRTYECSDNDKPVNGLRQKTDIQKPSVEHCKQNSADNSCNDEY